MKRILIFAAVVVVLIGIIKIGGPVFTASVGGDKEQKQQQETDITTGTPETEKKVTIEIENEGGETEPETTQAGGDQTGEGQPSLGTSTETSPAIQEYAVKSIDKTMYAIKPVNVRESYSTDSAIVSGLKAGQEVHATGETENGWIRIDYTGKTAYVSKSYLSTSKADVVSTTAAATKPAATKPATTKPATTKPATVQPDTTQPQTAPSAEIPETIAPFPG